MGYKYFDTPDGEDCFKKLLVASKYGALFGLFSSTMDVLLVSHPKGYGATVARFGYITVPFIGIAATFATSTCLSTSLRGKDDIFNYIIGGVSSGTIIGAWQKSIKVGSLAAIFLGIGSMITKIGFNEGWEFVNTESKQDWGDFRTIKYDFSLTKERPKEWVTDKSG